MEPESGAVHGKRAVRGKKEGRTAGVRLVPREHGASFMSVHSLLLGAVAGLTAGGRDLYGLLLAASFGALFLPLTAAVSVLSHAKLAGAARRRAGVLGAALGAAAVLALVHGPVPELLVLGAAAAALSGAYAIARIRTGPRSMPTQLAAIAGICLLAPLTWLLVAGADAGRTATERWELAAAAAFLAFGGTVPYVRERVRRRRQASPSLGGRLRGGAVAIAWQAVALAGAGAVALAGVVGALVPAAFLPGAVKTLAAIARPESRPPVPRIGYVETVISTVFAVLAGVGLGL